MLINHIPRGVFLLLSFLAWLPTDTAHGAGMENQQIDIKANELLTDTDKRTATFTGTVVARQGNITIHTDHLVIRYTPKGDEVENAEAIDNVRIVQGDSVATAGRALYDMKAGKITLTINPRIQQGRNSLTGTVITYSVADGKSTVTGGPAGRVQATIIPRESKSHDTTKP